MTKSDWVKRRYGMERASVTIDGNEAAATIAYKTNEVIAIYPITPSTPMGELADAWASAGERNLWGTVPLVQEMQSEGGAAGAIHGALQTGALTTTFTASQGLLLMIPNMYKIAGELTPTVFHIAARSVATQALSIFGDHSDVMAARATGWAILFANSVQEAMDFALIAQASTIESRVPFLHVFDGFRTSHEIQKVEQLSDADIRALIDVERVREHRQRALSPDRPVIRGTTQNPDVYFQARETVNPFTLAVPAIVQVLMERFAALTGRGYHLFDYVGAPDAERVLVLMGSGCECAEEALEALNQSGEKVGMVKVRLYRPFAASLFVQALPASTRTIAVLDRTKEPGSAGEPLYQDVVTAIAEALAEGAAEKFKTPPRVIGGRYGLASKEFTPAMVKGLFDAMGEPVLKNHFTLGIVDDVTGTSLPYDPAYQTEPEDEVRAIFWGLGADGTVSANKNAIKLIGESTSNSVQGYFVYDSKKSGSVTTSHLRFGPHPIRSTYLIQSAHFVAVHQFSLLERFPVLDQAAVGATLLLNSPYGPDSVWEHLPRPIRQQIRARRLKLFCIDADEVARAAGLGGRINTIMQACFFALCGVLPPAEWTAQIKAAIRKSYGKRGEVVVQQNFVAVDQALAHLRQVEVPETDDEPEGIEAASRLRHAPPFVQQVTAELLAGRGDRLPVSALPADGTYPTGTAQWEKRNIAREAPVWEPELCIQCGKCVLVCPHAVIRAKVCPPEALVDAPPTFKSTPARWRELAGEQYLLQVSVEDCTGCALCVEVCPAKDKSRVERKAINMQPQQPLRAPESANWEFFLGLPDLPSRHAELHFHTVKDVQLLRPLFEFSGACAGCGETPYLKLVSQLFGDRAIISNATGCSSIYGGNLPTSPWTSNAQGRGPAWNNSLFEDNAEFGLGMRLALDHQAGYARRLASQLEGRIGADLVTAILNADVSDTAGIAAQRERVEAARARLSESTDPLARDLLNVVETLVPRSVWIVGGDGWAYDIGYGGLDHVLASGYNVNVLVLDTEVYSNTGGQASKATARGAVAKFAAGGKARPKKDLGRMAMSYGNVYVAQVAMGANDTQVIRAFQEAEAYDGPSLLIAYSHCIAHGIDMRQGMTGQKLAVTSGYWPLYRYHPRLAAEGKNPFQLDCKAPSIPLEEYLYTEARFRMLLQSDPKVARLRLAEAQQDVRDRWHAYERMAAADGPLTREESGACRT
jgi:pyruvate-ferredoxin/flavodoxin oxidoreductase